jgi:hypothetical protein
MAGKHVTCLRVCRATPNLFNTVYGSLGKQGKIVVQPDTWARGGDESSGARGPCAPCYYTRAN